MRNIVGPLAAMTLGAAIGCTTGSDSGEVTDNNPTHVPGSAAPTTATPADPFDPAAAPTNTAPASPAPTNETPSTPTDPPPPSETPEEPTQSGLLIAYWANWTRGVMPVSSIPWKKLTHVAHAFVLPAAGGGLKNVSTYVDAALVAAAHANGAKVVASVGGWGANFDMNVDPTSRAKTVAAMAALCKTHGYDGIDLDWEYPTAATAPAWAAMVHELRVALDAINPALTISAAVSAAESTVSLLPRAALDELDWIGVMTYDYAGGWSKSIGHGSPLHRSKGGDGGSVSDSIEHVVDVMKVAPAKVFVGLPFYGYEFAGRTLGGTPVAPAGQADYRDIAGRVGSSGWTKQNDEVARVPYLTRAATPGFTSYDDADSIGAKCAYAKSKSLGGAIIWHLAGDRMSDGTQPLLDAAQSCR